MSILSFPVKVFKFVSTRFFDRNLYKLSDDTSKNVAILNLSYGNHNFGAVLVSYALQKVVRNMGFVPFILNYNPVFYKYFSSLSHIRGIIAGFNFTKFRYEYLNTTRVHVCKKSIKNENKRFDNFIFGSDQIWRYAIIKQNYGVYFGEFAEPNKNLISYAASFGKGTWVEAPQETTDHIKSLIKKFSAVSVRELSGIDICKQHFNIDAKNVLDPTLLLDECDYHPIMNPPHRNHPVDYIATSFLQNNDFSVQLTNILKNRKGEKVLNILSRKLKIRNKSYTYYRTVRDWLNGIKNANVVLTDSFHCVAFSIILKKNFICIPSENRGNARLHDLLSTLGIPNRLVSSLDDAQKIIDEDINYNSVFEKLQEQRTISLNFLANSLKKNAHRIHQ